MCFVQSAVTAVISYRNNKSISMYIFFTPNSYQNLKWIKEYKMYNNLFGKSTCLCIMWHGVFVDYFTELDNTENSVQNTLI